MIEAREAASLFVQLVQTNAGHRMGMVSFPIRPTRRLYTGDRFTPQVALLYPNGTAPYADVEVTLEGPGVSLGELVTRHGLSAPQVASEPTDAFTATLQAIAVESGGQLPLGSSTRTVPLFDDGVHDDGAMERDGIYGNPLDDVLKFEGTYMLHAVATYGDGCRGRREATWSVHVELGKTSVEVVETGTRPDGGRTGTVRLTPRDAYGSPLGPGRGDRFDVTPQPGTTVTGPITDNGNGSYDIPVGWGPDSGGPGLIVVQPERAPVPITLPAKLPWWCTRPGLIWLVVAAVLVLLILLLISLLS